MGAATQQEIEMMHREEQLDSMDGSDDMGRRGQILWIRGLTRLQHQVCAPAAAACSYLAMLSVCISSTCYYVTIKLAPWLLSFDT